MKFFRWVLINVFILIHLLVFIFIEQYVYCVNVNLKISQFRQRLSLIFLFENMLNIIS